MYIGASVQGLFDPRAGQDRDLVEAEGQGERERQAGVDPEDREEGDEDAEREGQRPREWGCPRRAAGPAPSGAATSCPGPLEAGALRKWSCPPGSSGRSPAASRSRTAGSPSTNSPTAVTSTPHTRASSPSSSQLLRAHREEQLVVLAAVKGQGQRRRRRGRARGRRPWGPPAGRRRRRPRRQAALPADLQEVEGEAVREVHPRPGETALGDRARRGPAAGVGRAGREGSDTTAGAEDSVHTPVAASSASSSRRAPSASRRTPSAAAPSVPVTTTRSPGRAPRAQQQAPRVAEQRHVHDDRPAAARHVAADEGHPRLRRPLEQAVVERVHPAERDVGRQAQAHGGVAGDAAHRRDVGEVDGRAPSGPGGAAGPRRGGSGRPRRGCPW